LSLKHFACQQKQACWIPLSPHLFKDFLNNWITSGAHWETSPDTLRLMLGHIGTHQGTGQEATSNKWGHSRRRQGVSSFQLRLHKKLHHSCSWDLFYRLPGTGSASLPKSSSARPDTRMQGTCMSVKQLSADWIRHTAYLARQSMASYRHITLRVTGNGFAWCPEGMRGTALHPKGAS